MLGVQPTELMQKLLLTVEQAFTLTGRGVIVAPEIPVDQAPATLPSSVTLKRPDGTTVTTKAAFHIAHIQTRSVEHTLEILRNPCYTCLLKDIDEAAVPVGTEIWIDII
ncbi:hypothetical protein [Leptolyngbya sp. 7M]|uniref:hypothetical protein n=1 Tax=Leptolyngbya sp. 7M TaxID=2812896 RepID=UPI001B8B78FD|nr:hypothetical protein [Leptolyngbya sp. 7M]QYO67524.1 hypothetical protein JVX88_12445 [Leptolyngbya sp. 7M]